MPTQSQPMVKYSHCHRLPMETLAPILEAEMELDMSLFPVRGAKVASPATVRIPSPPFR